MSRIVLITGANRGLGRHLAYRFNSAGYRLLLHSRERTDFDIPCQTVFGDLNSQSTITIIGDTVDSIGCLDVVIHNAGVYLAKDFGDFHDPEIISNLSLNLLAPILLTKRLWRRLAESRGQVIFINSLAAFGGSKRESIYAAAKAGLVGFANALQFEALQRGITLTSVHLGAMSTDMTKGRPDYEYLVDPHEAADAIVKLCSPYNSLRVSSVEIKRRRY